MTTILGKRSCPDAGFSYFSSYTVQHIPKELFLSHIFPRLNVQELTLFGRTSSWTFTLTEESLLWQKVINDLPYEKGHSSRQIFFKALAKNNVQANLRWVEILFNSQSTFMELPEAIRISKKNLQELTKKTEDSDLLLKLAILMTSRILIEWKNYSIDDSLLKSTHAFPVLTCPLYASLRDSSLASKDLYKYFLRITGLFKGKSLPEVTIDQVYEQLHEFAQTCAHPPDKARAILLQELLLISVHPPSGDLDCILERLLKICHSKDAYIEDRLFALDLASKPYHGKYLPGIKHKCQEALAQLDITEDPSSWREIFDSVLTSRLEEIKGRLSTFSAFQKPASANFGIAKV